MQLSVRFCVSSSNTSFSACFCYSAFEVVSLKRRGGLEKHIYFVHTSWRSAVLSPTLDSFFDGKMLRYLGITNGDGSVIAGQEDALLMGATTCIALIGHLDLYGHPLCQPPFSLFVLPLLGDAEANALLEAARKEWETVLRLEATWPGWLSKKVPSTLFQIYRELLTVGAFDSYLFDVARPMKCTHYNNV